MKHVTWVVILLGLSLLGISGTAASQNGSGARTDAYYDFQPNAPRHRIDYFAPGDFHEGKRRAQRLIGSVENKHLKPGRKCLNERRFKCAQYQLDFVLRWVPNHPVGLSLYSQLAMARNNPETALPYLEFALDEYPDYPSTYIVFGIHRYRMGDYESAERRLRQALQRSSESASAHYHLGLTLLQQGRLAEARQHAARAYDGGYPLPGLRNLLKERGAWAEAEGAAP